MNTQTIQDFFNQHKAIFFVVNLFFIVVLLKLFQVIAYPEANFGEALTTNNIKFMLVGMDDSLGGLALTFYVAFIAIISSFIIGSLLGIARYSNVRFLDTQLLFTLSFFVLCL